MSNDITPSRLPPAAVPSAPLAKPAEEVRAQAVEAAQAAQAAQAVKPAEIAKAIVETQPKYDAKESRRTLEEASEQLNQQMRRNNRDLSFSVDDVADKVVVIVKNKEGEVVRQIPDEAVLRVAHNLENIKGLMQDDKS